MIKSYKNAVLYIQPQGFIDGDNALYILTKDDLNLYKKRGVKSIMIDLVNVISMNTNGVKFFNSVFENCLKNGVSGCFVNPNKNIYQLLNKFSDRYFNVFETTEIAKLFCEEDIDIDKEVFIYSDVKENQDMLLFHLVKKGITPSILNSAEELNQKKQQLKDKAIFIEKSFLSRINSNLLSYVRNGIIYFYLDGYLDDKLANNFDINYYQRSLIIGFNVYAFDVQNVKGMNIHSVRFFAKLAVMGAEYNAVLCLIGLDKSHITKNLLQDMEDTGYLFFDSMEEFENSEEIKQAKEEVLTTIQKKEKKLTKDLVAKLPLFVNATIDSIELMTGITATKDNPVIDEFKIDKENDEKFYISSIGFYGDLDGIFILVFSENLLKDVSKILLGEEAKTDEEMYDITGEFCNIIVGNVKRELDIQDLKISLTLPKIFKDIEEIENLQKNKKSIKIKFHFQDDDFYFFLMR